MTAFHAPEARARGLYRAALFVALPTVVLAALALQSLAYLGTRWGWPLPWPEGAAFMAEHALWFLGVLLLRPSTGHVAWRIARLPIFGLLAGGLFALGAAQLAAIMPPARTFYEFQALSAPDPTHLAAAGVTTLVRVTLLRFIFTYTFRALWLEGWRSLRWRLTSLALGGGVLASAMVASLPGLVVLVTNPTQASTGATLRDARELAVFLEPAAKSRLSDTSLSGLLDYLNTLQARSRLAGLDPTVPFTRPIPYRAAFVYRPDGRLAAAVGPQSLRAGQGVSEDAWTEVVGAAADGRCRALVVAQSELAGCPVTDDAGRVQLVAAIARPSSATRPPFADLVGQLAHDLSRTLDVLSQAFLPIFLALGLLGYVAAQRLTRRLDQILSAAQAISAGFLSRRVPDEGADEISRVGHGFNVMAARLEENLAAINAEKARVEALLRANRTLTASASHELRTPITVMRAHLESAEMRGANLGPHEARVLNEELARLEGLVEDLFALSRSQLGRLSVKVEVVDLTGLGEALANAVAPLAGARQVTVIRRLPRSLPRVLADRQRLYQAALNLVQNALRYTPPGGLIMLEAARVEGRLEFTVADTGIGMSAEDLVRVFEPFYRADKARARETGGSGLGLALVRELVEAMGGRVDAESELGRGSRFTINLPVAAEPPGLSLPKSSPDERGEAGERST